MRNIKLQIAYDGTEFSGWQSQPGQTTIQGTIVEVLEKITQSSVTLHGAGRTDAGVHAAAQVANFKTESLMLPEEFQRACNALLPPSIRVIASEEVSSDFHSRWDAVAKTYRYRIYRGRIVSPFMYRFVHQDSSPLDFAAMAEAARLFQGEHDFTTFAASTGSEEDDHERITTRIIYRSEFVRSPEQGNGAQTSDEEWIYVVHGRSFLRYMVRKLVGTLVEVGRGKLTPADIPVLLEMRDRSKSGPTMPPQGLCMMGVEYENSARPAGTESKYSATS